MIKKTIHLLLLIALASAASAQSDMKLIRGILVDIHSMEPVSRVSVTTSVTGRKMITNKNGAFRTRATAQDTLTFSAIGYSTLRIPATYAMPQHADDSIIILLRPVSYQLRDVNVLLSSPFRDSLARAVRMLKYDTLLNDHSRIYNRPKGKLYVGSGVIYEGFVHDLYNRFSKEGKDNVHFEEFVRYSHQLQKAEERYNRKVVKDVTGLDNSRIDEFMLFCRLERSFIATAAEYDLLMAIKKCHSEFPGK